MSESVFPPELLEAARRAGHVVVFSGAGVSAESGLPTFREAQTGLWAQYDPLELATPEAFQRDPQLVWQWYAWRRQLVRLAQPNLAHETIVRMAHHAPSLTVITQNIDGLHQQAGSSGVIELHGNIRRVKCFTCEQRPENWDIEATEPPRCPMCGGLLRPDVVWFGEPLPQGAVQAALAAAVQADLFITVGTSGLVHPAALIPQEAAYHGAIMIEVNPDTTELSRMMAYRLNAPAGKALPAFVDAVWGGREQFAESSP